MMKCAEDGSMKDFTISSGTIAGVEYDSDTEEITYVLKLPYEMATLPGWFNRLFPMRYRIFDPIRALAIWLCKNSYTYVEGWRAYRSMTDAIIDTYGNLNNEEGEA